MRDIMNDDRAGYSRFLEVDDCVKFQIHPVAGSKSATGEWRSATGEWRRAKWHDSIISYSKSECSITV